MYSIPYYKIHSRTNKTQVQKIKVFNKIHVKHQNTEMARKKKSIFMYKSQWFSKILQMFFLFLQNFFFFQIFFNIFATAAKHSLIVVFHKKPLIVCEPGVLFLLPFIVG